MKKLLLTLGKKLNDFIHQDQTLYFTERALNHTAKKNSNHSISYTMARNKTSYDALAIKLWK